MTGMMHKWLNYTGASFHTFTIFYNKELNILQMVKTTPANAGDARDMGSIPGLGRSPGVGNGDPLQPGESPQTEMPSELQSLGAQRIGRY